MEAPYSFGKFQAVNFECSSGSTAAQLLVIDTPSGVSTVFSRNAFRIYAAVVCVAPTLRSHHLTAEMRGKDIIMVGPRMLVSFASSTQQWDLVPSYLADLTSKFTLVKSVDMSFLGAIGTRMESPSALRVGFRKALVAPQIFKKLLEVLRREYTALVTYTTIELPQRPQLGSGTPYRSRSRNGRRR